QGSTRLAPLISAVGMSIFLQNYVQLLQGARVKTIPPLINGGFTIAERVDGFVVNISYLQIVIIVVTVLLMVGLTWLISNTEIGRAQRAVEQDKLMSRLVGISVNKTISQTFIIAAILAAVAGVMVTLYYGVV